MMVEIQCTSCQTRYRVDARVLPEETPTFKCSRCGHVFTAVPRRLARTGSSEDTAPPKPDEDPLAEETAEENPSVESFAPGRARADDEPSARPAPPTPEQKPEPTAKHVNETFPKSEQVTDLDRPEELSFDFRDEQPSRVETAEWNDEPEDWQTGEEEREAGVNRPFGRHALPESLVAERNFQESGAGRMGERSFAAYEAERLANHGKVHSGWYFVGLCMLISLVFALSSVVICGAPSPAARLLGGLPGLRGSFTPPAIPASLVALKQVRAGYQTVPHHHRALVVTGNAENVSESSLHTVQIKVSLLGNGDEPLASNSTFCGNNVSASMVSQMTAGELGFFQRLEPPKDFVLKPLEAHPFVLVFIDPPAAVRNFRIAVERADPPPTAASEAQWQP